MTDEATQALLVMLHGALPRVHGLRDWRHSSPVEGARAAAAKKQSVLLIGGDRSVILSPDGFARWLSDFYVEIPMSVSGDPPSDEQLRRGLGWVLRVGPAGRELRSASDLDVSDPAQRTIAAEFIRAKTSTNRGAHLRDAYPGVIAAGMDALMKAEADLSTVLLQEDTSSDLLLYLRDIRSILGRLSDTNAEDWKQRRVLTRLSPLDLEVIERCEARYDDPALGKAFRELRAFLKDYMGV